MASLSMTFKLLGKDISASKAFKGVAGAADGVGKRVQGMGLLAGASAVAVGAAALKMGQDSVAAFTESETAQTKLQDAYARFPALATGNIDAIRALGAERAKVTRFDDDATAAAAAQLAQFGLNQSQLQEMIPLVQDYAAKTGQDLPAASGKVGKALLGNTKALKELGISYKPTGDKAKDYLAIQALLSEKVGGFAEKEGKSAAGQAAILGNQFGEVQETIGSALLPGMMALAGFAITTLIPAIQSLAQFVSDNIVVIGILAGVIGAAYLAVQTVTIATTLWTTAQAIASGASKAWAAGQWLLNAALTANPIGLLVVGIAALIAGLVLAWNKSETFRNVVTGVWEAVKGAAVGAFKWFTDTLWPWFQDLPNKMLNALKGLADIITAPYRAAFNLIASLWNNTVGGLSFTMPDWIPGIGGKGFDVPDIPMLANGGIVTSPTLALIGERGTETVVPYDVRKYGGPGGGVHIHITSPLGTPDQIARAVNKALRNGSRGGGVALGF